MWIFKDDGGRCSNAERNLRKGAMSRKPETRLVKAEEVGKGVKPKKAD
jgi:hypothetical protein